MTHSTKQGGNRPSPSRDKPGTLACKNSTRTPNEIKRQDPRGDPKKCQLRGAHRVRARGEGAHFREEPFEHEVAAVHGPGGPQRPLHHAAGSKPLAAAHGQHEHRRRVRQREEQHGGPPPATDQHAAQPPRSRLRANNRLGAAH